MEPTGAEPLRPDDPAAIGTYRLLGRLGEGGMGTVYLAVADDRLVALKVVRSQLADDAFAARFHGEVENARKVASFCTAQVLDNGTTSDGRPYMVTEYIAGTPLNRQIAQEGPLEPGPLHGVALGVAAALAAIHVAGLVHRDLKPANVILSLSGPRVIDFGIARALDASHDFTQAGELLGSPGWWAPEQVRGEPVSPWTDVFAWGCLVAYAGTGRHPYGQGNMVTLAARVLNSRPDLGALPEPLNELVRLATDPEPTRRPTAQDLLIALVGGALPTVSARDPEVRRAEPLVPVEELNRTLQQSLPEPADQPEEEPVPGAATDEIPAAGVDRTAAFSAVSDRTTEPPMKPPRSRSDRWLIAAVVIFVAFVVSVGVLVVSGDNEPRTAVQIAAQEAAGGDVAKRITVGAGFGVDLVVTRDPRCGLRDYEGVTAAQGAFCVIPWSMVNTGGELVAITATPVLLDASGTAYRPHRLSTPLPSGLRPGGRSDGMLVFDLPGDRVPARLQFGGGLEVAL
ncbi:serine/threonine-protein kinase [Herbidospora cretacea]|uniref:serine/threonine-protein kinase n=1 Tax=Herbidospora cretacea TaxID=28444 RepID=UPI00068BFEBE|nr:serine/threonine-protein kinase [Herbidospora cretacea]